MMKAIGDMLSAWPAARELWQPNEAVASWEDAVWRCKSSEDVMSHLDQATWEAEEEVARDFFGDTTMPIDA